MVIEEMNYIIFLDQLGFFFVFYFWFILQLVFFVFFFQLDQLSKYDICSDRIKSVVIRCDRLVVFICFVKFVGFLWEMIYRLGFFMKVFRLKILFLVELEDMVLEEIVLIEEFYDENLKKFGWRMEVYGDLY